MTKKYVITIEETVSKNYEVSAINEEEALKTAVEKYRNGEFVLDPGEVTFRQMAIHNSETGDISDW